LEKVIDERPMEHGENEVSLEWAQGLIAPNLQIGADTTECSLLFGNSRVSSTGLILGGRGFVLGKDLLPKMMEDSEFSRSLIARLWNGRDVTDGWRENYVIDTHGLSEEKLRQNAPNVWQHLKNTVFPERQTNRDPKLRDQWWLFRRANTEVRGAINGLARYIVTPETSKHRIFIFLNKDSLPEHGLVTIGVNCPFVFGVLTSNIHSTWALARGGTLEDRPRYNKSVCFETFPFPALEETPLKQRIRDLGERLDAHRKRQQDLHPGLTLTGIYNVLEKLRGGDHRSPHSSPSTNESSPPLLNAKEKQIHDQGLVTLLGQIHDELDAAVLEAYGWADLHPLTSEREAELLTRLVALNHERAAEEKRGLIRWLRPDYQNRSGDHRSPQQSTIPGTDPASTQSPISNSQSSIPWPDRLPDQVTLIRQFLTTDPTATPEQLSAHFGRKNQKRAEQIEGIVETLRGLGTIGSQIT
jgi:hypothetical protein